MRILSFFALALGLPLATLAQESRGDVVVDWNAAMTQHYESLPPPGVPPVESRVYAMAHLAMFNAANATNGRHASTDAAIAQAAHDVLAKSVPDAPEFDRLLARQLVAIPDGAAKAAGIRIGAKAADDELAARTKDGMAEGEGPYRVDGAAGRYRSTPPFDTHAPPGMTPPYVHFPNLGRVTPFALERGDQYRAAPPYALSDSGYASDLEEVKAIGGRESATRTPDQTAIAQFWYEPSSRMWNRIARTLSSQQPETPLENARLFAALNVAMMDALIAGFDTKYAFNFWRPFTAIHDADPAWEPLMLTPPMPEYVSTHSAVGGAASVVLAWFFRGDEKTFTVSSGMSRAISGLEPRTYRRISEAAAENARSRVFAGIHFRNACNAGLEQGRSVGEWVVTHPPFARDPPAR